MGIAEYQTNDFAAQSYRLINVEFRRERVMRDRWRNQPRKSEERYGYQDLA
jgi:hypothetical protein